MLLLCLFFMLNVGWRRFVVTKKKILFVGVAGVLILGVFASFRYESDEGLSKIMQNLGVPAQLTSLAPIYFAVAEGYGVNKSIVDIYTEQGPQYGAFTFAGFATIMPGPQIHARNLLSNWMGRENWETSSTVPTLVGQAYLEAGLLGVVTVFFLLGFWFGRLPLIVMTSTRSVKVSLHILLYLFFLLAIHTGFLDFIIVFIFLVYFSFFVVRNLEIMIQRARIC